MPPVRVKLVRLATLALVLAACSGAADTGAANPAPEGTADASTTTTGPDTGTSIDTTAATTVEGTTETTSGRPLAPDFTLALGDGGSYTLSEGAKPVYLVFWAEW